VSGWPFARRFARNGDFRAIRRRPLWWKGRRNDKQVSEVKSKCFVRLIRNPRPAHFCSSRYKTTAFIGDDFAMMIASCVQDILKVAYVLGVQINSVPLPLHIKIFFAWISGFAVDVDQGWPESTYDFLLLLGLSYKTRFSLSSPWICENWLKVKTLN